MKFTLPVVLFAVIGLAGCTDKKAAEDNVRQEAEAKARAEAAKKEMRTAPEAFKPRYNKRLDQSPPKTGTEKQSEPTKAP